MDIQDLINNHLAKYDFDIRPQKYARFSDQKCTPDIVAFIADCIINTVATKPIFTIDDIWQSQYFIQNTHAFFNKPWANDKRAAHEYDKVIAQPLNLLAYAHIIKVVNVGNKKKEYVIEEETLLDYISRKDSNAYQFLLCYFTKVLKDSSFYRYFEEYLATYSNNVSKARDELYYRFYLLINGNTPTHSELDIRRIFHKIFNVLACANDVPGSKGKNKMYYSDLMYNRTNVRDINKAKEMSRQEYRDIIYQNNKTIIDDSVNEYYIRKAISQIKKIETGSEVHDSWGNGNATQVHHIFPKNEFPNLSATVENLILLTATQHNTKAHPNNKTQLIDTDYQRVCLLAKADTIENSINKYGESFYRKVSFIDVINQGYYLDLSTKLSFRQIKEEINKQYRIICNASFNSNIVAEQTTKS